MIVLKNLWHDAKDFLRIFQFESKDEHKWFIDFADSRSDCSVVTLGEEPY